MALHSADTYVNPDACLGEKLGDSALVFLWCLAVAPHLIFVLVVNKGNEYQNLNHFSQPSPALVWLLWSLLRLQERCSSRARVCTAPCWLPAIVPQPWPGKISFIFACLLSSLSHPLNSIKYHVFFLPPRTEYLFYLNSEKKSLFSSFTWWIRSKWFLEEKDLFQTDLLWNLPIHLHTYRHM